MKTTLRVRFAPSPTGHLHVGGLRTAIFNWLFARHHNGVFLIRIEDTDVKRSKKEHTDSILNSLAWLSLTFDEPLVYQTSLLQDHKKALSYLQEADQAYPCFCEPRERNEQDTHGYKYDGTCRNKDVTDNDLQQPHAIRFKLPEHLKRVMFDDLIRGTIIVDHDQLDDFIIVRRDGTPTYNFCVVVDDMNMQITHVIRGEDHISNTPKQILLYQALKCNNIPEFAHLPLILGPSGNRLSKRDAAVSVHEYRKMGFLPDALFNYLVRLGWAHGDQEVFSREELISLFTLKEVGKKGAIFDMQKLMWLNGVYIRKVSHTDLLRAMDSMEQGASKQLNSLWQIQQLKALLDVYKERAETVRALYEQLVVLASLPDYYNISLLQKWHTDKTIPMLKRFVAFCEQQAELVDDTLLFEKVKQIAKDHGEKIVALAQPLRLALTGTVAGPGIFALLSIFGKVEAIKRMQALLKQLSKE